MLVVGGGLVGLSCAYYLSRGGALVTVLEGQTVGSGASRGNAGWICPSMVEPLPAPGVVREALGGLRHSDSPLYIHPSWLPWMAGFLTRFARQSTRSAAQKSLHAMVPMGRTVFECYDELASDGIEFGGGRAGYVVACSSLDSATSTREQLAEMFRLGLASAPGPLLTGRDLIELEPALADSAAAGFLLPDERWLEPSLLIDGLSARLRDDGVQIVEEAGVHQIDTSGPGVAIETAGRRFGADLALIAGGIGSRALCRSLGVRLEMQPGKGYSFSVTPEKMPRRVVYLTDAHVAITPMGESLRIAGTMEFDGTFDRFNPGRIDAIVAAASPYLRGVDWKARTDEWVGPRPMTSDGLPIIGQLPGHESIYVATGHNMLGVTLAPATGKAVSQLMLRGGAGFDLLPFSPNKSDRYRSRRT